jgi:hypothetical protein
MRGVDCVESLLRLPRFKAAGRHLDDAPPRGSGTGEILLAAGAHDPLAEERPHVDRIDGE